MSCKFGVLLLPYILHHDLLIYIISLSHLLQYTLQVYFIIFCGNVGALFFPCTQKLKFFFCELICRIDVIKYNVLRLKYVFMVYAHHVYFFFAFCSIMNHKGW